MDLNFADLSITTPDKPRHQWGDYDAKDKKSDRVVLRHGPSNTEVLLNARDFSAHTLTLGVADIVSEVSRKTFKE